jgi:hypothetical protein
MCVAGRMKQQKTKHRSTQREPHDTSRSTARIEGSIA